MVLILVIAWFLRPPRNKDTIYQKVFIILAFAVIIQYFSIYGNVFTRLADYYYQFSILLFPLMMESAEHRLRDNPSPDYTIRVHQEYIYTFLAVGITLFALWFYYPQTQIGYVRNYKFIWQEDSNQMYAESGIDEI